MNGMKLDSLQELKEAMNLHLDIVFYLDGTMYNISWRNHRPFICTCPDGDAEFYENTEALIRGKSLDKRWRDMEVDSM